MALRKNMTDEEKFKVCKLKPIYEETYKKGGIGENKQVAEILNREGSFVEIQKHANLGDDINAITVKIYFNAK
jgi:hypothetical protein